MKTDSELEMIANKIALEVKEYIKACGGVSLGAMLDMRAIKENAEYIYLEKRDAYNLDVNECKKLDKMFAKDLFRSVRSLEKERGASLADQAKEAKKMIKELKKDGEI